MHITIKQVCINPVLGDHIAHMVDAPLPISAITPELRWAGASMVQGSPIHFHCQVEACFLSLF